MSPSDRTFPALSESLTFTSKLHRLHDIVDIGSDKKVEWLSFWYFLKNKNLKKSKKIFMLIR